MAKMLQVSLLAIYQGRSYTLIVPCTLCSYKRNKSIAAPETSTTFPAGNVLESMKYSCGTVPKANLGALNTAMQHENCYSSTVEIQITPIRFASVLTLRAGFLTC